MSQPQPVDAFDLIIFGGTGDLATRKLIPALYHRDCDGQFPAESRIISVGLSKLSRNQYLTLIERSLKQHLAAGQLAAKQWKAFSQRIEYFKLDALDVTDWEPLNERLNTHPERVRVAYLATAPSLFGGIANGLKHHQLITPQTRIVLEKPLGHDHPSARDINNAVCACFSENQIYRIDHYLGKETVQNLIALRFANSLFEPLWRRGAIDHVQITVAEDLGTEGRIDYYDRIGALRDMVQNHLLQLVCLTAMEAPTSLHHDAVRDEKIKVLQAIRPMSSEAVLKNTVRGQYTSGAINNQAVCGYLEELGVTRPSTTETFVALKLEIDNWRWSNVPFYLRTGKRLKAKHSEIVIQFQNVPHSIFPEQKYKLGPNRLTIRLQPDEGVHLSVMAKKPGAGGFELHPVSLDLSFAETFRFKYPDAYERLLVEVLRGNPALFMRRDEVEAAWAWTDSIISGWEKTGQQVEPYVAGTWGPAASSVLLDRNGHSWHP